MARKKKTVEIVHNAKTLLEWYEGMKQEFPEKFEMMERQRRMQKEKLFGGKLGDDPEIVELHKMIEREYRESQDRLHEGPPLLQVRFQYSKSVTQTRYEASIFSSIVHEADNIMDAVTGDDDDLSDYETLVDVEHGGGLIAGLGFSKEKALPELRILAVKVTNAQKINVLGGEMKEGQIRITYTKGNKSFTEKTSKKEPDFRHRLGFNHVFNYRGVPIDDYDDTEIKISVRAYTAGNTEAAYALLSPHGCELGEVNERIAKKVETSITFWSDYLATETEQIVEYTLPLICGHPVTPKKKSSFSGGGGEKKKAEKKRTKKTDLKSLFA